MTDSTEHKCTPQACEYDNKAKAKGWRPEVVFGLMYEYIHPDQTVLDIGIGTGLASAPFPKAGLRVLGMDASADMLAACREKGITEDVWEHNLLTAPYPFEDESVDHVISVGVLNHFSDIGVVFSEASRLLRDGGTFGFTVLDSSEESPTEIVLDNTSAQSDSSVTLYCHSPQDVETLLNGQFVLLKSFEFTVSIGMGVSKPWSIKAYVARKIG